jgi:SAM-dependent methyltransferase
MATETTALDLEDVVCNLCGADDAITLHAGRDRLTGVPGEFTLVRCRHCGLIYLNPRPAPAAIAAYYPDHYLSFLPAIEDERSWFRRIDRRYGRFRRHRLLRRWIGLPSGAQRLLDVGCATGVFLDGMRGEGWQVQGVELSPSAAEYARRRFGLEVFIGTLEQAALENGAFDVVTLWDVLEHVYDPRSTLLEIHRLLKPGGKLLLSLPDPDTIEARVFGRYWAGLDMPRHLTLFGRRALERLLRETGYEIQHRSYFTGRFGVLVMSLQFWAGERLPNPGVRRLFLGLASSLPVRLSFWPYYFVADRLHQSSVVSICARKLT